MDKLPAFTRRNRPGWIRPNMGDRDSKRLKGLDEFVTPAFVGRMDRVRRRRQGAFGVALIVAMLIGSAIGLTLF